MTELAHLDKLRLYNQDKILGLMTLKNRQEYLASLPKKVMGAGCLFFNSEGEILIVKPVYRDTWNLPGGVVEANESPQNACIREVQEEIGIEVKPERLLCIDYTSKKEEAIESLQFIFSDRY